MAEPVHIPFGRQKVGTDLSGTHSNHLCLRLWDRSPRGPIGNIVLVFFLVESLEKTCQLGLKKEGNRNQQP